MYYNISIVKTNEKLLKEIKTDETTAFINGLGFVNKNYEICIVSAKKLPEKCIDYVAEKYVKNYTDTSMEEIYICGHYCYMLYKNKKKRRKKNAK